jgi:hypothetical protein
VTTTHSRSSRTPLTTTTRGAAAVAAALCLVVAVIHVIDQGGIALHDPPYIGVGYWLLEVVAVVTAVLLVRRPTVPVWVVALLVGAGPFIGYVVSRSTGLPGYSDDIGNWGEPLGVLSLVVEAVLVILAAVVLSRLRRRAP